MLQLSYMSQVTAMEISQKNTSCNNYKLARKYITVIIAIIVTILLFLLTNFTI